MPAPFALVALQAEGGSTAMLIYVAQIAAIFAIVYFILIRPQGKQRRDHEQRLQSLKKGDEIVTAGGIVGEVLHIREAVKDGTPVKTMEDRVTIRSGESRLIVERGRIARIGGGPTSAASAP
ncbi:MAG TPA: preprotein translocase subunit YajC [Gemmatimonadaceae bacterium]|nr:preprotein translocase subunit YajC [Gemmatimonadaceae bacterium]